VFVGFGFESFWCFSGIFLGGFCLVWVWVFFVLALVGCFLLYIACVIM